MAEAADDPDLFAGRVTLVSAIDRYLCRARRLEPRDGVTVLEIQKIAYFLQVLGQPLRLEFSRGRYGPYADSLNYVLDRLEGHYLTGFGDRSARVEELQPIRLTPGAADAVADWCRAHAAAPTETLDQLALLTDGFEAPYSLELLATVHYAAASHPPTADLDELIERVRAWSGRKARLFTPTHIEMAHDRLQSVGLLPALRGA
ncbi:hypothetical protein ABZU53_01325 [Micromonospora sp. NPDC005194]|uniref:hypothetical protein n=1 Tax=Micromonospora sp. NPDC005194 TaxID=3156870 RepID=UPI0033A11FAE